MKKPLTEAERQALARFKATLQSLLGDKLLSIRLFGSRARDEGTEDSDLDVLVVVQDKDRALYRRIVEESLDIDLAYDMNLAPTILSDEEYCRNREFRTSFYRNVEKFGPMLKPAEVAGVIGFVVSQPWHVHVNDVVVRPTGQDYP